MKLTDALSLQCENFWGNPILANEIGLVESLIICRLIWKQDKWGDWVEHTQQDFERAIGVSPCMQRRAVGVLKAMKILEMKQIRLQHRTFYRINKEALNILEDNILERLQEAKNRGGSSSPEVRKPHLEDEVGKPNLPKLGNRTSSNVQNGSLEQEEQERENVDSDESTPLLEDSETDSPEAPEAPPQDQAEAPPPAGPRRAPRMPPPRQNALGSFETSRDAETDEDAAPPTKTSPTRQSQRRQSGFSGDKANQVAVAWNKLSAAAGLPGILQLTKPRAKALAQRLRDPVWLENWEAALAQVPKADWRTGKNDRQWRATFDWFVRPDTVAKLIEERDAAAPVTGPAPAPKPKSKFPVGSPEWEKEMLSR